MERQNVVCRASQFWVECRTVQRLALLFSSHPSQRFAQVGLRISTFTFMHKQQDFCCYLTHRRGIMCGWTLWAISDPSHRPRQKEKVRERETRARQWERWCVCVCKRKGRSCKGCAKKKKGSCWHPVWPLEIHLRYKVDSLPIEQNNIN